MTRTVIFCAALIALTSCDALDKDVRTAKELCKSLEADQNYTYTTNNMTLDTCSCTMEYMRKTLEDGAWRKFLVILNGGDPFPEPSLPQSSPVGDFEEAPEPDVPPELLAIENASNQAEAVCLAGG